MHGILRELALRGVAPILLGSLTHLVLVMIRLEWPNSITRKLASPPARNLVKLMIVE